MPDNPLSTRKATARRLVLARRARIPSEERARAGTALADLVMSLPEIAAARAVLGFASFGGEISSDATMERVLAAGKRLLVPYVDGMRLRAAEIASVEDLAPGYRGIREPVRRTPVNASEADAVLVPGVAFDAEGRRLGYGGGFYDDFLRALPPSTPRIGLCYDVQVIDAVPVDEKDEQVGVVVTERRIIRAKTR